MEWNRCSKHQRDNLGACPECRKESRVSDLEAFILRNCDPFNMTKADAALYRGIQSKALNP